MATTDGVGTKLKLAIALNKHDTIGIDLVAMCVNDLIVQGAEPLLFLDYYATGKLDIAAGRAIIQGIAEGCRQSGCALIGGETAEMPGMYAEADYDLAGFSVGAVERDRLITGREIAAGDVVLGLASSGVHSNGFSLVRRLVDTGGHSLLAPAPFAPGISLGEALLTPTMLYVRPVLAVLKEIRLKGLAHITGGGLVENIPRVLPDGLGVEIDGSTWKAPGVFGWLAAQGVETHEMARVFNCGIGMVAITEPKDAAQAIDILVSEGIATSQIGTVVAHTGAERVQLSQLEVAWRG